MNNQNSEDSILTPEEKLVRVMLALQLDNEDFQKLKAMSIEEQKQLLHNLIDPKKRHLLPDWLKKYEIADDDEDF